MAVDSKNREEVKLSASYEMSDSAVRRQEVVRSAELEKGLYLVIPQLNFAVKTVYNNEEFNSPRIVIAQVEVTDKNLTVLGLRSFKVSNFTAQMTRLESEGIPEGLKCITNADGLRRLPAGTGAVLACRDFIPKRVNGKRLEITDSFFFQYDGTLKGYMPHYEKNAQDAYEVALDEDGEITWDSVSIPSFHTISRKAKESDVKAVKAAIKADSQFKDLLDEANNCIL